MGHLINLLIVLTNSVIVENELDPVGNVREDVQDKEEDEGQRGVVAHQPHDFLVVLVSAHARPRALTN
jgi:hypothetical protein